MIVRIMGEGQFRIPGAVLDELNEVDNAIVEAIAKDKMPDLNCFTVESAMKMGAGTARSMGLNVEGKAPWEN